MWYQRESESEEQFEFQKSERDWIENELYVCACSFPYWYYRYFFIRHKDGRIARPEQQVAQSIYLDILAELDSQKLPILLLVLKARQLGCSTISIAIVLWIAIFRRGSHNVLASAEEEKSIQLSDMMWLGLENLPLWMQPTLTRDDKRLGPEFGEIQSDILIQHGAQTKGIARGSTPQAALLSEVAYYPNPIETIESSLLRAMHENPRTFLVLESTAKKKGDWFHRTWLSNRDGEAKGYNRFTLLFLPWYVGSDKYPTSDWIRNHPVPADWRPLRETTRQAADAELYVRTNELLSKYLGKKWRMPVEQQWFWEFNYVEASREDLTLKAFYAEMAADERSAFQSKKYSVFSVEVLERLEKQSARKHVDYAVTGDGIDRKFSLQEYQSKSLRRVEIPWITIDGQTMNWRLVPLARTPDDEKQKYYLRVWEPPKAGFNYTVGIDIGSGIGQNRTVYEVLRIGRTPEEPDVQVAQLCSPWISAPESPAFALMLGIWYGQHMSPTPEALMVPETQIAVGDFISHQLAKLGYTNFHYMRRYDQRQRPGQQSQRRGWATVSWSRQMMMEAYEHAIKSGWVVLNSEDTLEELSSLESEETDSGKMKYDHADNENSDCYMAGGIAYFVSHDNQTIMERMKSGLTPKKKAEMQELETKKDTGVSALARMMQREEQFLVGDAEGHEHSHIY